MEQISQFFLPVMQSESMTRQKNEEKNRNLKRFLTDCTIERMEKEGEERAFALSFSSEEPYERWWGTEILSHKNEAVNLKRLNSIGVVLYNHDRDRVIGKIEKAWIENGRGKAKIVFDSDDQSDVIFQKVCSGTLKGVSVGYVVEEWEEVGAGKKSQDGRFAGECSIATKWTPLEISIVSIPADDTVGVGRFFALREKGVSRFYYDEKQLQINQNLFMGGK